MADDITSVREKMREMLAEEFGITDVENYEFAPLDNLPEPPQVVKEFLALELP